MQDDDLYKNDGTYFYPREPREQASERKRDKAKTLEALAVIKDVIAHFDERIRFRDSLESIKVDLAKDPLLHQKACEVNNLLKMALMEEKQMLEEMLEVHAPGR